MEPADDRHHDSGHRDEDRSRTGDGDTGEDGLPGGRVEWDVRLHLSDSDHKPRCQPNILKLINVGVTGSRYLVQTDGVGKDGRGGRHRIVQRNGDIEETGGVSRYRDLDV